MSLIRSTLLLGALVLAAPLAQAQYQQATPDRNARERTQPAASNQQNQDTGTECAGQFGKSSDGMIRDNVGTRRPCF